MHFIYINRNGERWNIIDTTSCLFYYFTHIKIRQFVVYMFDLTKGSSYIDRIHLDIREHIRISLSNEIARYNRRSTDSAFLARLFISNVDT